MFKVNSRVQFSPNNELKESDYGGPTAGSYGTVERVDPTIPWALIKFDKSWDYRGNTQWIHKRDLILINNTYRII